MSTCNRALWVFVAFASPAQAQTVSQLIPHQVKLESVEYLGKRVACRHCHAVFEAIDPLQSAAKKSDSDSILERAEQLLALDAPSVILRHGDF